MRCRPPPEGNENGHPPTPQQKPARPSRNRVLLTFFAPHSAVHLLLNARHRQHTASATGELLPRAVIRPPPTARGPSTSSTGPSRMGSRRSRQVTSELTQSIASPERRRDDEDERDEGGRRAPAWTPRRTSRRGRPRRRRETRAASGPAAAEEGDEGGVGAMLKQAGGVLPKNGKIWGGAASTPTETALM